MNNIIIYNIKTKTNIMLLYIMYIILHKIYSTLGKTLQCHKPYDGT